MSITKWIIIGSTLLLFILLVSQFSGFTNKIDYNTEVKPILNQHCIHCHGGVKRSGNFGLMTREEALKKTESDVYAIVPGHPKESELIRRITAHDEEDRMPLEKPALAKSDIKILKQWIKEGADWGLHWSYEPVVEVKIPKSKRLLGFVGNKGNNEWAINEIDYFIQKKHQENGWKPNQESDKGQLLRRVSLDLIGLPAPDALKEQFLKEEDPISYEQLIDSLLASPHFGERWTSMWLDLARYADSRGFERDFARSIWEYRDYLIRAFNQDLPYDQFIIEQLAGDLLSNPTDAQYIATGFHRNTPTNDEGGTDNEEYRVAAVIDRVNTTWEVMMGTTFACIQCHGHPYDPFPHDDYYESMAFFNNSRDEDTAQDYPVLRQFSEEEELVLNKIYSWVEQAKSKEEAEGMKRFLKTWQPVIYSIATDSFVNSDLYDTKYLGLRKNGLARIPKVNLTGKNTLIMKANIVQAGGKLNIHLDRTDGEILTSLDIPNKKWSSQFFELPLENVEGVHDLYLSYKNPSLNNETNMGFRMDWFYFTQTFPGKNKNGYAEQKQQFWRLMEVQTPHTLIMIENPMDRQRETHVFDRGNWLTYKEKVEPKVPDIFDPLPENAPKNRLGLAQWITDKRNPLTSRTMVNRLWEQIFGIGIVETVEDLGSQSPAPSHPELLDWLAWQFMNDYNWSMKTLLKTMVTSAAYRQSPSTTAEKLEIDPYNRYLIRGPRVRLNAEQIRDQALVISGLFNPSLYGEPVMPPQPKDLWQTPYNNQQWKTDTTENRYRRAVYTYMKRSSPYPSMETFDVAPRQVCVSRRIRTNTPLQALVTLNDPVYMETARAFAQRMQIHGSSAEQQIAFGYEIATGQILTSEKSKILQELHNESLSNYKNDEAAARQLINAVESEHPAELAALTLVANAIMNLDEFVTK